MSERLTELREACIRDNLADTWVRWGEYHVGDELCALLHQYCSDVETLLGALDQQRAEVSQLTRDLHCAQVTRESVLRVGSTNYQLKGELKSMVSYCTLLKEKVARYATDRDLARHLLNQYLFSMEEMTGVKVSYDIFYAAREYLRTHSVSDAWLVGTEVPT